MLTTRSQKRRNNQQESTESVSEGFVSPIVVENSFALDQDAVVAGPSEPVLKLLKPETRGNIKKNIEEETENETRSFYTPTKAVGLNSTQNNDPNASRNMVTGVLTDCTNQPKIQKVRSQSQPASKERPA